MEPLGEATPDGKPPYARLVHYTPVRQYPAVADGKATALLGAYGLILSTLLFFSRSLGELVKGPGLWQATAVIAILAPLLLLVLTGIWLALRTLTLPLPPPPSSLAFFQRIAAGDLASYETAMQGVNHRQALRHLMEYHHVMAVLCTQKFRIVERSVSCLRAVFFLWLLLLLRLSFPTH